MDFLGSTGWRTGRPANQSRAGPLQSTAVEAATSAPTKPPVSGAVSRIGTATMLRASRAPRLRCSTKTPSTAAAAAHTAATVRPARITLRA